MSDVHMGKARLWRSCMGLDATEEIRFPADIGEQKLYDAEWDMAVGVVGLRRSVISSSVSVHCRCIMQDFVAHYKHPSKNLWEKFSDATDRHLRSLFGKPSAESVNDSSKST